MKASVIEVLKYCQKTNTWNSIKDFKEISSMDYVVYIDGVFYELGDLIHKLMEENKMLLYMVDGGNNDVSTNS